MMSASSNIDCYDTFFGETHLILFRFCKYTIPTMVEVQGIAVTHIKLLVAQQSFELNIVYKINLMAVFFHSFV